MTNTWKIKRPGERDFTWEGTADIMGGALALGKPTEVEDESRLCRFFAPGAWTSVERVEE